MDDCILDVLPDLFFCPLKKMFIKLCQRIFRLNHAPVYKGTEAIVDGGI